MQTLPGGSRLRLVLFALCVAGLFLIANYSAYQSFFTDDDLDNMANARLVKWADIGRVLADPSFVGPKTFPAVWCSCFLFLWRSVGLDSWPYGAPCPPI